MAMEGPALKTKAFSYIRWSSDRQTYGDSLKRQLELSKAYAALNDLDLDTRLKDEGVSAYHGLNRKKGDLSIFLDQVETGVVPKGSYLLVESLDRVSRENVIDAQTLFLRIINAGITIVTLLPHRTCVYSRETILKNPTDLIMTIVEMIRAHEESAHKGERVAKARATGRAKLKPGVSHVDDLFTRNVPAWIDIDEKSGKVSVNAKKSATIHRIFEMLANGIGRHKIIKILNGEKEDPLGPWATKWHPSHIHHLLHGRSVLGEFQPHLIVHEDGRRKRVPTGDPIVGYFDEIVDQDLYDRAHVMAATNRLKVGRKGNRYNNLLTRGMSRCDVCSGHMAYQHKGAKSVANYVCANSVLAACENKTKYRHSRVEAAILHHLSEVHAENVAPPSNRGLEIELAEAKARLDKNVARQDELAAEEEIGKLRATARQIAALEVEEDELRDRIKVIQGEIIANKVAPSISQRLDFIASVRKVMASGTEDDIYQKRAMLADALRDVVTDVVFYIEGHVDLIVLNGIAAYRIHINGEVDEAWVRTGNKVGFARPEAFLNFGRSNPTTEELATEEEARAATRKNIEAVIQGRDVKRLGAVKARQ